jgi:hypothetical protein
LAANGTASGRANVERAQRDDEALLGVVRQLRPVSFRYKANAESKHSRYGFVAQELEALLPAVVHADPVSGFRYVRYTDLLAVLVLGAQQVEALTTSAEMELDALDARLDADAALLDPRLAALERALVDLVASGSASSTPQLSRVGGNVTTNTSTARYDQGQTQKDLDRPLPDASRSFDSDTHDLLAELETLASNAVAPH